MMESPAISKSRSFTTKVALIWMSVMSEPLQALYTLFLFILRKDLGATALQIAILATLRPVISVFSFYWSSNLLRNRSKLLSNLMGAYVLARLPFLLFPFIDNVWYLILAAGIYQLFYRAGTPALMEILKLNVEKEPRERLFSILYVLAFIESILIGIFMGKVLDGGGDAWRLLFFVTALLSISSVLVQMRIPLPPLKQDAHVPPATHGRILQPIKDCFHLMKRRPDFAKFQWGFMIGGFWLMLVAPASTIYYADVLSITYSDLTIARYIWMGLGVIGSTFLWRKALKKVPIQRLTGWIIFGFALHLSTLILAQFNLFFLNLALLFYGIAQGGSHLVWHLSGTLFAEAEDSSKYTAVNVLMVGVRGLIAPLLGALLTVIAGALPVIALGTVTCLYGAYFMGLARKKKLSPLPG